MKLHDINQLANSRLGSLKGALLICIALAIGSTLHSQTFEQIFIPVQRSDASFYANPWAGGINNLQISEIDLDDDGLKDLFIFDRAGNHISCFINEGIPGVVGYRYAPEYNGIFPELFDFVLLRDYDGDGLQDIFASSSNTQGAPGVEVYHTQRIGGKLKFELITKPDKSFDILYYRLGTRFYNIQIDAPDYPAFDDVDGDGDMDLLTFEPLGGNVYFFKNMDVENNRSPGTFDYELQDACWGKFFESGIDENISLSSDPNECYNGFRNPQIEKRHSGSTLLTLDIDGDKDKDVIIGDLTSSRLVMLTNGGDRDNAYMNAQDARFPQYDVSVDMPVFLTPFYIDLNNDNKRDLVVGVNVPRAASNYNAAWLYLNEGMDDVPIFSFQRDHVFIDEMIDFGTGVRPVFVDYNADGLMDIVAGNDHYYEEGGNKRASLFLFENVGTSNAPAFKLIDEDYLSFSKFSAGDEGTWSFAPTFGDLDDDGDLDLLVGELNGRLFHAENIAGPNQPFEFGPISYNYMNLYAQRVSVPAIIDVDEDGLNDIVLGTRQSTNDENRNACGNFYFFKNIGSKTNPLFDADIFAGDNTPCFGNVILQDIKRRGGRVYSSPYFYNHNGEWRMYAGTNSGIKVLGNIVGNAQGDFDILDEMFGQIVDGEHMHVALEDIDGDNLLEMIVGTYRGGMNLYQTDVHVDGTVASDNPSQLQNLLLYPNPFTKELRVEIEASNGTFDLYEINGAKVFECTLHSGMNEIQLADLNVGMYIYTIKTNAGISTGKVMHCNP